MTYTEIKKSILTLVSLRLFIIGLVMGTPASAVAGGSGTWTMTGSLNTVRGGHTATLLANSQVLVAAGESAAGFLASAELYNPTTGKWTITGSMATSRINHTATLLPNGEVLVAGGVIGTDANFQPIYTNTAELYNPSTGQWRATGGTTVPRALHGATLLQNGHVLVAGGSNSDGSAGTSAELYDPTTGTWKATGSMNQARTSAPATLLENGQVLMARGTAELYDPFKGQWTMTGNMYFGAGGSAALLLNGDVLSYGNTLPSYASEFFKPKNTWNRTFGQNNGGISFGPLALLGTGKVLLGGGKPKYGSATSASLLYDPSTNYWTLTGGLNQFRAAHTLTRLFNGQALAAGGSYRQQNSNGTFTIIFLASAELYTP